MLVCVQLAEIEPLRYRVNDVCRAVTEVAVKVIGLNVIRLKAIRLKAIRLKVIGLNVIRLKAIGLKAIGLKVIGLKVIRLKVIGLKAIRSNGGDWVRGDIKLNECDWVDLKYTFSKCAHMLPVPRKLA